MEAIREYLKAFLKPEKLETVLEYNDTQLVDAIHDCVTDWMDMPVTDMEYRLRQYFEQYRTITPQAKEKLLAALSTDSRKRYIPYAEYIKTDNLLAFLQSFPDRILKQILIFD